MEIITGQELKERLDQGEPINLIDCREPFEYEEYNIGAKLIPLGDIQNQHWNGLSDLKDQEVIIHCRSGKRSETACLFLEAHGFAKTVNVAGGILAWKDAFGKD